MEPPDVRRKTGAKTMMRKYIKLYYYRERLLFTLS